MAVEEHAARVNEKIGEKIGLVINVTTAVFQSKVIIDV